MKYILIFFAALIALASMPQKAEAQAFYPYEFPLDTITNSGTKTLVLPRALRPLQGNYSLQVSVVRTNISGTTNVGVSVQETGYPYVGNTAPTLGWAACVNQSGSAATTAATTATTENLNIPWVYGQNVRIVLTGGGTHSTSVRVRVTLKKRA